MSYSHKIQLSVTPVNQVMHMLRTDCKLDQFVNGPPVYKRVIPGWPAFNVQRKVVLFRNRAERFESWPNSVEARWMVYKWPERHESCTSLPNKQPVAWTAWKLYKLAEQTARGLNSMKAGQRCTEAYKQGSLASRRPNQRQRGSLQSVSEPRWRWLGLACKTIHTSKA